MKFIGQYIQGFIARFRNDVYLEDIDTGTIASGGNLGLDSNNKIVKATETTGDITSVLAGTGLSGGGASGDVTLSVGTASAADRGIVELATTAETTTGTDTARAVTPDGLKDGYQGSTNVVTVGTISTGEWRGTAINAAYLNGQSGTNTGDETLASINALDITEVGTIDSGVWNGTAIASAYLDADTAHLSTSIYVETCNFSDNLGTTEHFIPFVTASENTAFANVVVPWIAPVAGKLLKVHWRSSQHCNISSNEMSFRLYKISDGTRWSGTNESLLGTKVVTGPARTTHAIADFTSGLESGAGSETNAFAANDLLGVSIQHSQDQGVSEKVTVTLVFELDFSSY